MKVNPHLRRTPGPRRGEQGYVLLVIALFLTLLVISLAAVAPKIGQQIKRDREDEMIQRGSQYERAIKRYYRKFGRYPAKIEDLENTNNVRFLRKRYKDPMSPEGDWKILHPQDVKTGGAGNVAGSTGLNVSPAGGLGSSFGGSSFGASSLGSPSSSPNASSISSTSSLGSQGTPDQSGQHGGSNALFAGVSGTGNQPGSALGSSSPSSTLGSSFGSNAGPTFGGGAMVGVASKNKDKAIHEFKKKDHYDQWQFIYDPMADRGGLLRGPYTGVPPIGVGQPGGLGIPGSPGMPGGPQAQQPTGFGTPIGQQPVQQPNTPQQ